jgi:hypothetical protein
VIAFFEENWKGPVLGLAVLAIPVVGITYHAFTTQQGGSISAIVVSDEFGLVKQGKGVGVERKYIVQLPDGSQSKVLSLIEVRTDQEVCLHKEQSPSNPDYALYRIIGLGDCE